MHHKTTAIFFASLTALAIACGGAPPPPVPAPLAPATVTAPQDEPIATATNEDTPAAPSEDASPIPIDASDPQMGSRTALVTIVEFSDLQCPFCARAAPTIAQIEREFGPENVRVVWKHSPLPFHQFARPAAEAAAGIHELAGDAAFFRFEDAVFQNQRDLSRDKILSWAGDAGVSGNVISSGLDTKRWAGKVDHDLALGRTLGVTGTPAFFINGVSVVGAQPYEKFKAVVAAEIDHAKSLLGDGTARERVYVVASAANYKTAPKPDLDEDREDTSTVFKVPVGQSPVRGAANAQVTIVEFGDFQCPYTKRVQDALRQVRDAYGTKVRIVWKDEPLPFHPRAMPAANFARAARAQKGVAGFWDVHDRLFSSQPALEDSDFATIAAAAGLRVSEAIDAAKTKRYARDISADEDLGEDVQASGTPHFFINGRRLVGAQPFEKFKAIIDEEITKTDALLRSGVPAAQLYDKLIANGKGPPPPEMKSVHANPQAPSRGAANARVVIQEFADFQCPFCKRAEDTLKQVMQEYGTRVKFVWRNEPLPMHPQAEIAAEAAMEAKAQKGNDGFWRMHDALFAHQGEMGGLERTAIDGYAHELGLDMDRFDAALDRHAHKAEIDADNADASAAQISGTPSFTIGPYFLSGAQPYPKFRKLIELALNGPAPKAAQPQAAQPQAAQPQPTPQVAAVATTLGKQDIVVGTGATAKDGDRLVVHYTGTLTDGTVFDTSRTRGQPFDFVLGRGSVIKGWDQGLLGMRVGGRRKLTIPPDLAYGSRSLAQIPANSTLIFDVELLDIRP